MIAFARRRVGLGGQAADLRAGDVERHLPDPQPSALPGQLLPRLEALDSDIRAEAQLAEVGIAEDLCNCRETPAAVEREPAFRRIREPRRDTVADEPQRQVTGLAP